jgi:hypothetical protein
VNLYDTNKDNKLDIPIISGKVDKYSFEIITKDNPLGLILGYATDCCQVIGNSGESCLRMGYTHSKSGFFVVKKDSQIYAQSWIWEKDTKEGKILCFDSLEVLGKDFNKSKAILSCYQDASKILVKEHKYSFVLGGIDGNSVPKGLVDTGVEIIDRDSMYRREFNIPFNNVYTDTDADGVVVFAKKEK